MLAYLPHRHLNFRDSDFQAAAEMHGVDKNSLNLRLLPGDPRWSPFRLADLPSDEVAISIAQRALLLKGIFEIWGEGSTVEAVKESIRKCPPKVMEPWLGENVPFKFIVDSFGRKLSQPEQLEYINGFADVCPFKGKVDLKQPSIKLWVIVCNCTETTGLPPGVPVRIIVAREIATSNRVNLNPFLLKNRRYLGPTSMDAELSFAMCNVAHVRRGHLVYDPFAGTGSILIAAAALGAHTVGGDIDIRVIRDGKLDKKGRPVNVYTNFGDYKLPEPLGLLRMDAHNPAWHPRRSAIFDAILCDPPYGVRAGGRKMVAMDPNKAASSKTKLPDHIPATYPYSLGECLRDLLESAARLLVVGGRLSYWMPDFYEEEDGGDIASYSNPPRDDGDEVYTRAAKGLRIPEHPCLRAVANDTQVLSNRYLRRLITMVKHKEYVEEEVNAWKATLGEPTMAIDKLHDVVYESKHALADREGDKPLKKRFRSKAK